jgi:hypothetical protein
MSGGSFLKDTLKGIAAIVFIVGIIVAKLLLPKPDAPDDLGCKIMRSTARWTSCKLLEHDTSAVDLRGCDKSDRHSYLMSGRGQLGFPGRALVCCTEWRGGCRVVSE